MKKLFLIATIVLLSSVVFAELSEQTENEVSIMSYENGAKVRLLQLEKSVTRNIVRADAIITEVDNMDMDTSNLSSILEELKLVKEEIQNVDLNQNKEDLIKNFVDLKDDAIDLTKDFREALHLMLTTEQLSELKIVANSTEINQINERIRLAVREYNALRLESMISNKAATNKIRNGEMDTTKIKSTIKEQIRNESAENKDAILQKLGKMKNERNRFVTAAVGKAIQNQLERKEQRLQNRLEDIRSAQTALRTRIQNRINTVSATTTVTLRAQAVNSAGGGNE